MGNKYSLLLFLDDVSRPVVEDEDESEDDNVVDDPSNQSQAVDNDASGKCYSVYSLYNIALCVWTYLNVLYLFIDNQEYDGPDTDDDEFTEIARWNSSKSVNDDASGKFCYLSLFFSMYPFR